MEEVTLLADSSRALGSRPARRLRSLGQVPAVLYGHGTDPMALSVDSRELRNALTGDAVPDELYGTLLTIFFAGLEALRDQHAEVAGAAA